MSPNLANNDHQKAIDQIRKIRKLDFEIFYINYNYFYISGVIIVKFTANFPNSLKLSGDILYR